MPPAPSSGNNDLMKWPNKDERLLVGQAFVAVGEVDDAAVGEAVLGDEVLHDGVVAVGVDADVGIP